MPSRPSRSMRPSRRLLLATATSVAVAGSLVGVAGPSSAGPLAGSLASAAADGHRARVPAPGFGVFYVNGRKRTSNWSDNRTSGSLPTSGLSTTKYQARVTYLMPRRPIGPAIVLVPGYGLAADIWMTTPDRRMGWAQLLYAKGYPVYVLSPPDRGESMPIDGINKCLAGAAPSTQCSGPEPEAYYGQIGRATLEDAWPTWRFGPEYATPYADSQFPSLPLKRNYIQQFGASFVPYLGTSDIAMVKNTVMNDLTTDAITALLREIGPSVIVLHSAAGTGGFAVAENDPDRVRAVIAIETTKCPEDLPSGVSPMAATPFLGVWGDHITKKSPGGHWDRRASCRDMVRSMRATGGAPAKVVSLPARGIHGNSHMMMQDRNNAQVLGIITRWLESRGI